MQPRRLRLSRQQLHLLLMALAVIFISIIRYKHTYWQAPNSTAKLTHVEAMQLTQAGKIPYAREFEYNSGEPTGDMTYKEDIYPYDTTHRYPVINY